MQARVRRAPWSQCGAAVLVVCMQIHGENARLAKLKGNPGRWWNKWWLRKFEWCGPSDTPATAANASTTSLDSARCVAQSFRTKVLPERGARGNPFDREVCPSLRIPPRREGTGHSVVPGILFRVVRGIAWHAAALTMTALSGSTDTRAAPRRAWQRMHLNALRSWMMSGRRHRPGRRTDRSGLTRRVQLKAERARAECIGRRRASAMPRCDPPLPSPRRKEARVAARTSGILSRGAVSVPNHSRYRRGLTGTH